NRAKNTRTLAINIAVLAAFFSLATNAFYTANSGLSRTLPPSFLAKEKQILALIFMKQIEK
ncbi:hypothetical protein P7M39_11350, partial [Vibrio parahaemolyticus]|nr:hypothetical protein [Vibrio parahaemolyticus]MDG2863460.1 hypothetical protein [Vibrio parahaemolyticus]